MSTTPAPSATFTLSTDRFLTDYEGPAHAYNRDRAMYLSEQERWEVDRTVFLETMFDTLIRAEVEKLKRFLRARRREMKADIRRELRALSWYQWRRRATLTRAIPQRLLHETIAWLKLAEVTYAGSVHEGHPLYFFSQRRVSPSKAKIGLDYLPDTVIHGRTEAPVDFPHKRLLDASRSVIDREVERYRYEGYANDLRPIKWPDVRELMQVLSAATDLRAERTVELTVNALVMRQAEQVRDWVSNHSLPSQIERFHDAPTDRLPQEMANAIAALA